MFTRILDTIIAVSVGWLVPHTIRNVCPDFPEWAFWNTAVVVWFQAFIVLRIET